MCSKARKCLGMLYRKILIHSDMYTCRVLYTTFLRPHLEYACQVWDPHLLKDIEALEGVQKFALRACCKKWTSPYDMLLTQFDLPTLQSRRRYFKLCLLFKIINKLVDFPECPITFRESKYNIRSVHQLSIYRQHSKTNSFLSSFFPSTSQLWNNVPSPVLNSTYGYFKQNVVSYCT